MSEDDVKILAGVVILAALIICVFVWLSNNGLGAQIAEIKNLELRNSEAIARLGAGGTGGASGTPTPTASPASGLPTGVTQIPNGASCSGAGNPKVIFFTDPYCPYCVNYESDVNSFIDKFKDVADITIKPVPTHSDSLAKKYPAGNVTLALDYFECMQEQGLDKIQAFKVEFYKNLKNDGTDFVPFTPEQLANMTKKIGADSGKMNSCLAGASDKIRANQVLASGYGNGSYFTPMMVLDCRFTGPSPNAKELFCYAYPDAAPCKT